MAREDDEDRGYCFSRLGTPTWPTLEGLRRRLQRLRLRLRPSAGHKCKRKKKGLGWIARDIDRGGGQRGTGRWIGGEHRSLDEAWG
jgi:hypothetical protein